MIIFATGGERNNELECAIKLIKEFIIPKMTLLYIPLAADKDEYESNYADFIKHLGDLKYSIVDIIHSADELKTRDMSNYSAIILDDGNPFKLIDELKSNEAFEIVTKAAKNNTAVLGIGAGAVALGNHIEQSEINHTPYISNTDITGFDFFNGRDIFIYSDNYNTNDYTQESQKLKYAAEIKDRKIVALHKNVTLYKINKGIYKLNEESAFDSVTKNGIYRFPYKGKISFDIK